MTDVFDIGIDDLPAAIPLFPLPRVILLPRVQLPLNIFEPRYLALVSHAMSTHRLIGMIQPMTEGKAAASDVLCQTGCVGRITSFAETDDGRYLITLKGVSRFQRLGLPEKSAQGYLTTAVDWKPYHGDFTPDAKTDICRDTMVKTLHAYFEQMGMSCDQWEQIRNIGCERLVATLSVVCPFDAPEKQALLEAATLADRAQLLHALLENAVRHGGHEQCSDTCH